MDNIYMDNPLASSSQRTNYSPDHLKHDQMTDLYKTQTWSLLKFSRFCEEFTTKPSNTTPAQTKNDNNCNVNINNDDGNDKDIVPIEWESWTNQPSLELIVRLAGFGHLVIMYGSEIVESYFLVLAKKWLKAVVISRFNKFSKRVCFVKLDCKYTVDILG